MNKSIFFDIDGTLLDSNMGKNTISKVVKNSIEEFQKDDNYVFIATGRPYAFLCDDILDFKFDGYVLMNGSLILNKDKLPLYKCPFDKNELKELIKSFEKYNVQYILQDEKYSYTNKDFKDLEKLYRNIGITDKYIKTDYNIDDINIYKIETCCTTKEGTDFCRTLETEDLKYIYYDEFDLFEIYSKKNSKASGILRVLEHHNIHLDDSYAFGDGENDIEMLSTVGCGIAMGNASDKIKSYADKVTLSVHEDGVAHGIKNYIVK